MLKHISDLRPLYSLPRDAISLQMKDNGGQVNTERAAAIPARQLYHIHTQRCRDFLKGAFESHQKHFPSLCLSGIPSGSRSRLYLHVSETRLLSLYNTAKYQHLLNRKFSKLKGGKSRKFVLLLETNQQE